jgi:hypothetical protein
LVPIAPGLRVSKGFALVAGSGTPADCTTDFSLSPGATCNISISFSPGFAGTLAGIALLSDNSINGNPALQTISLAGTSTPKNPPRNGENPQVIYFPAIASQPAQSSIFLTVAVNTGLPLTLASSTPRVCTVSGITASLLDRGICTIKASQAGSPPVYAAANASQSFVVTGGMQTVTFAPIQPQTAKTSVPLTATASSELAVSFTSNTPSVCTIQAKTNANLIAAGTCTITASQAGNASYAIAAPVQQSFVVNPAPQTITFDPITPQTAAIKLPLTATSSSGLGVSYVSTTATVCTISGKNANLLTAGTCTITASQAGNAAYAAATPVTESFAVSLASQTITFDAIPDQTAGTKLTLAATASSGLAVTYTASPSAVCAVSGKTANLKTSGTCTITASQPGNSAYSPAPSMVQSITVN